MKPKTIRTIYWSVTIVFALLLLMAGVTEAMQHESGREIMRHLGYPEHVLLIIGIGKVLAAIALVQRRFRTIKEWAYAGLTFNLIGACVARAAVGDSIGLILSPLVFLAVMFLSYFLWQKVERLKLNTKQIQYGQTFDNKLSPAVKVA